MRDKRKRSTDSILVDETSIMERKRRRIEQDGHRGFSRVYEREHSEDRPQSASLEEALQNDLLQHAWLDGQRFDGIDPNLNPEPPLNSEARREYDNKRREQEKEKQNRLENTLVNAPRYSTAPRPRGP